MEDPDDGGPRRWRTPTVEDLDENTFISYLMPFGEIICTSQAHQGNAYPLPNALATPDMVFCHLGQMLASSLIRDGDGDGLVPHG